MNASELDALERTLKRSWADLRRLRSEVDDLDSFDEDSNAWLPVQAYYAVYKAILSFAIASGQPVPKDHRSALNLASKEVVAGRLPYPWSAYCGGCPQTGSESFGGLSSGAVGAVHVLSNPDPATSSDRTAMFLRTTRQKELDRRFAQERSKGVQPGRGRRNLSRATKDQIAARMPSTTVFDIFWRLRKKANYEDADVFSLGAAGISDARAFADALSLLADATVASLESLVIEYVGMSVYGPIADRYSRRISAQPGSPIHVRATLFHSAAAEPPF